VDLLLFVVEALVWNNEDEAVLESITQSGIPVILVVNKVDKVRQKEKLLPVLAELSGRHRFEEVFPLSAAQGDNCDALGQRVIELLPEGEKFFPDDQLTDRSERFFASELIREQLIRRYAKEIPYALTVEIERFQDEGKLYRVGAIIWVERPGQKNIIIGRKGEALKEVASEARLAMEQMFEKKIFLEVWVKIKKSWSSDENALSQLGYGE
jgi:GTP-binding protein Era